MLVSVWNGVWRCQYWYACACSSPLRSCSRVDELLHPVAKFCLAFLLTTDLAKALQVEFRHTSRKQFGVHFDMSNKLMNSHVRLRYRVGSLLLPGSLLSYPPQPAGYL